MHAFLVKAKRNVFVVAAGVLLLGLAAGLNLQNSTAQAQANGGGTDYFLKIDGIEGESTDRAHPGEIELDSFAWSKGQPGLEQTAPAGGGGGGGAGKVQVHDIHFTQQVSKASPRLMKAAASGKHFKQAILTVRKSSKGKQQDYLVIKLTDAMISSYQVSGNNPAAPRDEFSLNFAQVEYAYYPQRADGSNDAPIVESWDFKKNDDL